MRIKQKSIGVENIIDSDPRYGLVRPGKYYAVVKSVETGSFRAGYGNAVNPEADDGKWDYVKVTPTIELINENNTVINSQDFVIGVVNNAGELVDPKNKGNALIWSNFGGAFHLLSALGCIADDGLDYNPETIANIIVRVRTFYRGYDSVKKINYDPDQLMRILIAENDGVKVNPDEIKALLLKYNVAKGYSTITYKDGNSVYEPTLEECQFAIERGNDYRYEADDERFFLFNCIVGFWRVTDQEADDLEVFYSEDHRLAFATEADYDKYTALSSGADVDGEDWS